MKYPKMIVFDYGHTLLWEPGWDSEPVRRGPGWSLLLCRGGALGLFVALRRKVGVQSHEATHDKGMARTPDGVRAIPL